MEGALAVVMQVIAALEREDVRYVVVGSIASSIDGTMR